MSKCHGLIWNWKNLKIFDIDVFIMGLSIRFLGRNQRTNTSVGSDNKDAQHIKQDCQALKTHTSGSS